MLVASLGRLKYLRNGYMDLVGASHRDHRHEALNLSPNYKQLSTLTISTGLPCPKP